MNCEEPTNRSDDEEAIGPVPPPVADASEISPMESQASGEEDSLIDLPTPESEAAKGEPFEPSKATDPPLPEVVADAAPDGDIVSAAAETNPELTESAPASTREEGSMPDADEESDLAGGPEEGDGPLDVEIELPSDAPLAGSGLTIAGTPIVDAASSPPAEFEPTSDRPSSFIADATPVVESPADPSLASDDFATATLPSSGEQLSPRVFVWHDPPQSHLASFDSQSTGDWPVASSVDSGAVQAMAPGESHIDVESFRMPPLVLEVSRSDWEQRMEQLIERFAMRVDKLVEERIEDKLSYRDHVQAAQMGALYGRG